MHASALDVTHSALYEPNDKNLAKADTAGLVSVFDQPGDVGIMVRYQGKVAVFRATEPLGAPIAQLPPARNFIDELAFKKLGEMGVPPSVGSMSPSSSSAGKRRSKAPSAASIMAGAR